MYCGLDSALRAQVDGPGSAAPNSGPARLRATAETGFSHTPVLVAELLALLQQNQVDGPAHYLDCTFGGGGHTRALLESDPAARVTALDRDPAAQARASALAAQFPGRLEFHDLPFSRLNELNETSYAGVLFDLGVSSFQLDEAERGFSFRQAAPADMRLDPRTGMPAAQFLEEASRDELVAAVRDAGEEPRWRRVVEAILRSRGTGRLARTDTLADVVASAVGAPPGRIHPATRTFQGLRIALNAELDELTAALPKAVERLAPGGVLAIISFHSLEDRIAKRFLNRLCGRAEHAGDATPAQLRHARAELLTRRPLGAGELEVAANPRSRSARLRAARMLLATRRG
jgi:16S rRNA (cytosine1402-N4)-methyltransferase